MKRKTLLLAVGLLAVIFFYFARAALAPLFLGVVFAYIISPVISALERKGLGRCFALIVVYIAAAAAIFLIFLLGIPRMTAAVLSLQKTIAEYSSNVEVPFIDLEGVVAQLQDTILGYAGKLITALVSTLGVIINVIVGLVLSFYIILDKEKIKNSMLLLIPKAWRGFTVNIAVKVDRIIKRYAKGLFGVSLVIGILLFCALMILNVRHAFLLAVFAGVLEVIPYFGGFVGAIPAVITAAAHSTQKAIWTAAIFTVVQQLESVYITPKILGGYIRIHPVIVIMAVIVGGHLFGFAGMLFAVPACGIIKGVGEEIIEALEKERIKKA
ncbi:MAG: AI-2E family transporter [Firmicutes bacterium]|nr:AI-2E family transporter [Bacillota bacterium]